MSEHDASDLSKENRAGVARRTYFTTTYDGLKQYPIVQCAICSWIGERKECGWEGFQGLDVLECPKCFKTLAHINDGGHHGPLTGTREALEEEKEWFDK